MNSQSGHNKKKSSSKIRRDKNNNVRLYRMTADDMTDYPDGLVIEGRYVEIEKCKGLHIKSLIAPAGINISDSSDIVVDHTVCDRDLRVEMSRNITFRETLESEGCWFAARGSHGVQLADRTTLYHLTNTFYEDIYQAGKLCDYGPLILPRHLLRIGELHHKTEIKGQCDRLETDHLWLKEDIDKKLDMFKTMQVNQLQLSYYPDSFLEEKFENKDMIIFIGESFEGTIQEAKDFIAAKIEANKNRPNDCLPF